MPRPIGLRLPELARRLSAATARTQPTGGYLEAIRDEEQLRLQLRLTGLILPVPINRVLTKDDLPDNLLCLVPVSDLIFREPKPTTVNAALGIINTHLRQIKLFLQPQTIGAKELADQVSTDAIDVKAWATVELAFKLIIPTFSLVTQTPAIPLSAVYSVSQLEDFLNDL